MRARFGALFALLVLSSQPGCIRGATWVAGDAAQSVDAQDVATAADAPDVRDTTTMQDVPDTPPVPDVQDVPGSDTTDAADVPAPIDARETFDLPSSDVPAADIPDADTPTTDDATPVDACLFDDGPICCTDNPDCTGRLANEGEDACNPAVCREGRCVLEPLAASAPCEDGDPCTTGDTCVETRGKLACKAGAGVLDCNDGNPCTDDSCVPDSGCTHGANTAPCGAPTCDGLAFIPASTCQDKTCPAAASLPCDDGNPCTDDSCDADSGCVNAPNSIECGPAKCDGLAWTATATCAGGACGSPLAVDCDDGNVCTDDACVPETGCANVPNVAGCADARCDGLVFRPAATCADGSCPVTAEQVCDDDNACTDDACDPANGCVNTPNAAPCAGSYCDGLAWYAATACSDGACTDPVATACDDGNVCTDDACDGVAGCLTTDNAAVCGEARCEGDALVPAAVCAQGACPTPDPQPCPDDDNPCTDPACELPGGCTFASHVGTCASAIPGCGGQCLDTTCVFPAETLNGLDDDCDGYIDEDFDLDHDGVCAAPSCAVNAADACPTVWTPDNDAGLCPAPAADWTRSRPVALSQAGAASTWRRTNEPVEVPLANGILDDSVVGYWKLDGGSAKGYSSIGSNGTVLGGSIPASGAFGDEDGSIEFDGTTGYVDTGSSASLNPPSQLSVSAWFVSTDWTENRAIVSRDAGGGAANRAWHVMNGISATNLVFTIWQTDGTERQTAYPNTNITLNAWHHVAAVADGQAISLYLDGKRVGTPTTYSGKLQQVATSTRIGVYSDNAAHFKGRIDEVVVWNRALSPDEIAAYYASRRPYATPLVPGAQADFDDVRVTETSPQQAEHLVPVEVVGVKPHSDSPCPMTKDDGTWKDRDDLCGVVGFWKLDGDGKDASGNGHDGVLTATSSLPGRFGNADGAIGFDGGGSTIDIADADIGCTTRTIDAWIKMDTSVSSDGYLVTGGSFILGQGTSTSDRVSCSFSSNTNKVTSTQIVRDGNWHHVACVSDGKVTTVYVDGLTGGSVADPVGSCAYGSVYLNHSLTATNNIHGVIDDVLLHSVAKSPEYLWRRSHPGLPTVRFLAHTTAYANAGGKFDFLDYALRWADPDATATPAVLTALDRTSKSLGLLSGAIGYAGWWRFNEGTGTVAADASTSRLDGRLLPASKPPVYVAGSEGTALRFDGTANLVQTTLRLNEPAGTSVTTEAVVSPDTVTKGMVIASDDDTGCDDWIDLLRTTPAGKLRFSVDDEGKCNETQPAVESNQSLSAGTATAVASVLDGQARTASLFLGYSLDNSLSSPDIVDHPLDGLDLATKIGNDNGTTDWFLGTIDSVRVMRRALTPDEFLHYPLSSTATGAFLGPTGTPLDTDADGIPDDGDGSGVIGDHPCADGETTACDDNAPAAWNPGQEDADGDLVGDAGDVCPAWPNPSNAKCGGTCCPELTGYTATCNAKDHCEYANVDPTGWRQYDVWILVPPGSFTMGAPADEAGSKSSDRPLHPVTFAHGFLLAKFEVTVALYDACRAAGSCSALTVGDFDGQGWGLNSTAGGRTAHPQNSLTWQQSRDLCSWLNGRLPSEAEWEYAALGPIHHAWPWGDSPSPDCTRVVADQDSTDNRPWACDACTTSGCSGTLPVGSKPAGAAWSGAMDMIGNVWEWIEDCWHADYTGAPDDGSAWIANCDGTNRMIRGGSFYSFMNSIRADAHSYATFSTGTGTQASMGARCARNLPTDGDADGDGTPDALDCAPADPNVHPGAAESCNRKDDDCDGLVDEDLGSTTCGLGACSHTTPNCVDGVSVTCAPLAGAATETCNGRDDDCDGSTDEDLSGAACSTGKPGVCAAGTTACNGGVASCVQTTPATVEMCDGKDNDCNGATDEANASDCMNYLLDQDGDGYGVTGNAKCLCAAKAPYSAVQGGDCLDSDKDVRPGKAEICNGKDDNCDGQTDPENTTGCLKYYEDADGDGYGATAKYKCLCAATGFYSTKLGGDCDETNAAANPGKKEACATTFDDNCDGKTQDQLAGAIGCKAHFYDADNDGWGTEVNQCWCKANGMYRALTSGDCNDTDAAYHPGAAAICGKDADCDGGYLDTGEECDPGGTGSANGCGSCKFADFYLDSGNAPDVAVSSSGRYLAVWDCWACLSGGASHSRARAFGADNRPLGPDFPILSDPTAPSYGVRVAALKDGRFVVAFIDKDDATSNQMDVYARILESDGKESVAQFKVNTGTSGTQNQPAVAALASGGFVFAWTSQDGQDGSGAGVYGQRFSATAAKTGSEFRVNTTTANDQSRPEITTFSDGTFAVAWTSRHQDGSEYGSFAQRYTSAGAKKLSEFQLNVNTTCNQWFPTLALLPGGLLQTFWLEPPGSCSFSDSGPAMARLFDANNVGGTAVKLNGWESSDGAVGVAVNPDNSYIAVLRLDGVPAYFAVQRFKSDGTMNGTHFSLPSEAGRNGSTPRVATFPDGGFVVVWASKSYDNATSGSVDLARYTAAGQRVYVHE